MFEIVPYIINFTILTTIFLFEKICVCTPYLRHKSQAHLKVVESFKNYMLQDSKRFVKKKTYKGSPTPSCKGKNKKLGTPLSLWPQPTTKTFIPKEISVSSAPLLYNQLKWC